MKIPVSICLGAALIASIGYSHFPVKPRANSEEQHNQWLSKCMTEIETIKVGTTRKEVDKLLDYPGGTLGINPVMLVSRKSPYIFVDVKFKMVHAKAGWPMGPSDRVISISKPYLQRWDVYN